MTIYSLFKELLRRFPLFFLVNNLLLVLAGAMEGLTLLALAPVMECLSKSDLSTTGTISQAFIHVVERVGGRPSLPTFFTLLVVFQLLTSAASLASSYSILKTKYAIEQDLLLGSFHDFFSARWFFFSSHKQGTLLNTFSHAVTDTAGAFSSLTALMALTVRIAFLLIVPIGISWPITMVSVAFALVLVWPFFRLGAVSYRWGQLNISTANHLMASLFESLGNAKTILGFGNQDLSENNSREAFKAHSRITIKSQTLVKGIEAGYRPMSLAVLAGTVAMCRGLGIPLSEMTVLILSLIQVVPLIGQAVANRNSIQNLLPSYLQIKELREEAKRLSQPSGQRPFTTFQNELTLTGVSFFYPGGPTLLNHISLKICKGQYVAIVGESGVGKSTLIDLIMAFHEPTAGTISLDGIPLQEFDIRSYRQRIGYVPQESVLFNRSVRENLLWSKPDASDDDIRKACREANALDFIERLPQTFDTVVGDRGVRLSGGQAQRVSLARAILRRPTLLVLDEATSSLDTHSERLIQQAVESIAKDTTVIAIAHRLSTIMNAGHIVVLKDGRVAEEGTYASLIKADGCFSKMVNLQSLINSKAEKLDGPVMES